MLAGGSSFSISLNVSTITCLQEALLSSWVSICAHRGDFYVVPMKLRTQSMKFLFKKISFHFFNPPVPSHVSKVKSGSAFHKRYWPNDFQWQMGMREIKDGS